MFESRESGCRTWTEEAQRTCQQKDAEVGAAKQEAKRRTKGRVFAVKEQVKLVGERMKKMQGRFEWRKMIGCDRPLKAAVKKTDRHMAAVWQIKSRIVKVNFTEQETLFLARKSYVGNDELLKKKKACCVIVISLGLRKKQKPSITRCH